MLIQVLAEYADHYLADQLDDVAWESKPVPWLLEISPEGSFLGAVERTYQEVMGKKTITVAKQMSVPRSPVNRNSGEHPLLAADDIAYVLGAGNWSGSKQTDRDKADSHHAAFVAFLQVAANSTHLTELESCARFYANSEALQEAREALQTAKPGSIVALSVGRPLVELDEVRDYWRKHYETEFNARMEGDEAECLITGNFGPVAPTHEKIKGTVSLGGQASGVSLMSFDKEAFRSYGWERNTNSPVSPNRALAYVLALNDLLRPGGSASNVDGQNGKVRRCDKAGVGFLFWTRKPSSIDPFASLDPKDEGDVKALLNLKPIELDANDFYLAGISGNGGRLRVRYWVADSLAHIQQNILAWHEQLRVDWPWADARPVCLWQLQQALEREGNPPAHEVIALMRRALEGRSQPLGYAVLAKVLARLRRPCEDKRSDSKNKEPRPLASIRVGVGLVRLCVNDLRTTRNRKEREMSEGYDPNCIIPAYLCGQLMYVYENLQRVASGDVNSSVIDRYFSLASTSPARAFPVLEKLAIAHLRKTRRDNAGAAKNIDKRLGEIHFLLQPSQGCAYPKQLDLEQQGLFILGYYHERSKSIREVIERSEANKLAAMPQN
ncbi:MAG: type I-C CRISPR-associated protein Cas8c/Csd1 [Terracidiphilus sp.]|nr:type I-C CRISPR-associated protein Cas8c/Csd1 [Terracidiphilus sp.]